MDTAQQQLIAALIRRLEGRSGPAERRTGDPVAVEPEHEVLLDLEHHDTELIDRC